MGNRRRKDDAHDVGDSMPGTVGDSNGTAHDRRGGPTFDPDDAIVPESASQRSEQENQEQSAQQQENDNSSESDTATEESEEKSTRMEYAERYGESWPDDRQRRFLREHDVSAKEMGWKLTE